MGYRDIQRYNNDKFSSSPVASNQNPPQQVGGFSFREKGNSVNAFDSMQSDRLHLDYNRPVMNPFASDYFDAKFMGINLGEVTGVHKDELGGIDPFSNSVDFEHLRRNSQGYVSTGAGLLGQFLGKTSVNVLGGVVGGFYSLGAAAVQGDSSLLFDNSVNRALDNASEWVDKNNTVFTSQQGRKDAPLGLFSIEGLKDMNDAYSFIAGAVASELIVDGLSFGVGAAGLPGRIARMTGNAFGKAKKGVGLGNNVSKTGNYMSRTSEVSKLLEATDINDVKRLEELSRNFGTSVEDMIKTKKAMDMANSIAKRGRQLITGTFWEAGLEARNAKDSFMQDQEESLQAALNSRTFNSEEEKQAFEVAERAKLEKLGNAAGLWTFGLNSAVLNASNMVQFPSIFGNTKYNDLNKFSNKVERTGLGKVLEKNSKKSDLFRTFGNALKSPATEFLEETGQGAISSGVKTYYESMAGTRSSTGELIPGVASLNDSILTALEETYGTKEGLHEGFIGALVGAVGLPMLKRNKKGKLRSLEMTGGVFESMREHKAQQESYKRALEAAQFNDFDQLLEYNKDNAILSSLDGKKFDVANLNDTEDPSGFEVEKLQNNKVFRYTKDKLDKGLMDHIDADIKELEDMPLEEYTKVFNKDGNAGLNENDEVTKATAFTQAQKDKEVKDFKDKVEIYKNAYKTVYAGARMDAINNDFVSRKYFDTLVYALSNEKIMKAKQNALIEDLLQRPEITLTKRELVKLAELTDKYKGQEDLVEEYLKAIQDEKNDEFEKELGTYKNKVKGIKSVARTSEESKMLEELADENQDTESFLNKVISMKDTFDSVEWKALADNAPSLLSKKQELQKAIQEQAEFEASKAKKTKIDKRTKPYREYKNRKEQLKSILKDIAVDMAMKESDTLKALKGKTSTISQTELNEFFDLKRKANSISKEEQDDSALLDKMSEAEMMSTQDSLRELAKISGEQKLALEIASNLFNTKDFTSGYKKMLNVLFTEDISNMSNFIFYGNIALQEQDDEFASEILVQLKMTTDSVKSNLLENRDALNSEFINKLETMIGKAEALISQLNEFVDVADTKEEVKEKTINDERVNKDSVVSKAIDKEEFEQDTQDKEIEELESGVNQNILVVNNKSTHSIRTNTKASNPEIQDFQDKLNSGEIKYNSGGTLSSDESMEDAGFVSYLESNNIKESYYSGKEKAKANPGLLMEDFNEMDADVATYVTHAPVRVKVYNKEVKQFAGKQFFEIDEDAEVVSSFLYFSPEIKNNDDAANKRYNELLEKAKKLKDERTKNSYEEFKASKQTIDDLNKRIRDKYLIEEEYLNAVATIEESRDSGINNSNDIVLFNFRKSLLFSSNSGQDSELKFRVGNIVEGKIEKLSDTMFNVEEHALVTSVGNPNGLVTDINDINQETILFGDQTGGYRDLNGNSVKLNRGSLIDKKNSINSRLYFTYKTVNGQQIPVILNRARMGSNEALLDEIMEQVRGFLVKKNPTGIITLKNKDFSFLEGKTYEEFFKTFFDKNNSGPRKDKTLATLDINKKSLVLYLGNMEKALETEDDLNMDFENIKMNLGKMRYYLDAKSFVKLDGSFNREMMDFVINNKLINHSFNTSLNRDKIFRPEDDFKKSMQIHLLNTETIIKEKKSSGKVRVDEATAKIYNLFGLNEKKLNKEFNAKDRPNLSLERIYITFNSDIVARLNRKVREKFINKESNIDYKLLAVEAFDEVLSEKLTEINSIATNTPSLVTEGSKERIASGKPGKQDIRFIDNLYKIYYEYLNKVQKNKDFIDALVSNAETANYDEQYKKILIDPTRDRVVLNKGGFSDVQKNGDRYEAKGGMEVLMPEELTNGTPEENREKAKNLLKSFVLLKEANSIFLRKNYEKNRNQDGNQDKIYFDFGVTYFLGKSGELKTQYYEHSIDEKGRTLVNKKDATENNFFETEEIKTIEFYVEKDGSFRKVQDPLVEFEFNKDGTIKNGIVTVNLSSPSRTDGKYLGIKKVAFSGTENNANRLKGVNTSTGFINSMKLPGLNTDFSVDKNSKDKLEGLLTKFNTNISRLNNSTIDKSSIKSELKKKVNIEGKETSSNEIEETNDLVNEILKIGSTSNTTKTVEKNDVPDTPKQSNTVAIEDMSNGRPDDGEAAALFDMMNPVIEKPKENVDLSKKSKLEEVNEAARSATINWDQKMLVSNNKESIKSRIKLLNKVVDEGKMTKEEAKNKFFESFSKYGINTYENLIDSSSYLYNSNNDMFDDFIIFVNKIFNKDLDKDDFNDCFVPF